MRVTDRSVEPLENTMVDKFMFIGEGKFLVFREYENLFMVSIGRMEFHIQSIDKVYFEPQPDSEIRNFVTVQNISKSPVLEAFIKKNHETGMEILHTDRFWNDEKEIDDFVKKHFSDVL